MPKPPVQFRYFRKEQFLTKSQAPQYLRAETRKWFDSVVNEYELQPHHVRLLIKCAGAYDRSEEAREAIAKHGLCYTDRFGSPRARPECAIERDSRLAFARLLRELDIDVVGPDDNRPPALRSNKG
jgi:hypothetical protein